MELREENAPDLAARPQTWKLILAYDGTDFSGWQVQPGEPTIQGELQAALGRVTGERPLPQGSGRTGVHALGQVASFALHAKIPAASLQRALNRTLPQAIRVVEASLAAADFHARHSTVAKTYEYRVFQGALCLFADAYINKSNDDAINAVLHSTVGQYAHHKCAAVAGLYRFLFTSGPLWKIWSPTSSSLAENQAALWGAKEPS